jgi:hypothetical protein
LSHWTVIRSIPFAGASSGAYEVVVKNKLEEDMKLFISECPALKKVKVEKFILPQGIRP